MVIAVLAVIWVVALTPMMLRKLAERRFSNFCQLLSPSAPGHAARVPRLAANAHRPGDGILHGSCGGLTCPVVDRLGFTDEAL